MQYSLLSLLRPNSVPSKVPLARPHAPHTNKSSAVSCMPQSSRDRTSHSLSTRWHATPPIRHQNTLQPPNTSSDISQAPLHSASVTTPPPARKSRHTQTRTGQQHSQTAAQLANSYYF